MSIDYPKLLSAFTIDAALTLTLYVDDVGTFDEEITVTVPAGTYFLSWDNQSDDFLNVLMDACYTALVAQATQADYNDVTAEGKPILGIDANHKVTIDVGGGSVMRFAWTEDDGATVAGILGFDATADLDYSGTQLTGDYQHAYGWYASSDGQLVDWPIEDTVEALAAQSVAIAGDVTTQYLAERFKSYFALRWLERGDTHSNGVGYTEASTDPYERNKPLECWWREAVQGIRFRLYRSHIIDVTKAEEPGTATGGAGTTIIAAGKSWTTDPQEHAGKLVLRPSWYDSAPMRWYVSSHNATTLTLPNGLHNEVAASNTNTFYIFAQRYKTYVLDIGKSKEFAPNQLPRLDQYEATFNVRRYV